MSYTDSNACQVLACYCVACGKEIVDSISVNTGMGPDCRKKYMVSDDATAEHRDEANKLVFNISAAITAVRGGDLDQVGRLHVADALARLGELGFSKLKAKLADKWVLIRITEDAGTLAVIFPYDDRAVQLSRRIYGRKWDGKNKVNTFPAAKRAEVWRLLCRCFPGFAGIGPKGSFVVGGAS